MKAKVSIVLGFDSCSEVADSAADDVDAAAAAQAQLLLKTGSSSIVKKETLIDRISRRFQTIEHSSSSSPAAKGMFSPPRSNDAGSFYLQPKQVNEQKQQLMENLSPSSAFLFNLRPSQELELSPRHRRGQTTGTFSHRPAAAASAVQYSNVLSGASSSSHAASRDTAPMAAAAGSYGAKAKRKLVGVTRNIQIQTNPDDLGSGKREV